MARTTPRRYTWAIAAAAVALMIGGILLALPIAVRHLAVQRVEAMTGRPVTITDVDLNLFTRRIVFTGVRIASPADAPPLAEARRVEARFRLGPLLRGDVYLDRLLVAEPTVQLARFEGGRLSVQDVVEHWLARPAGEPLRATVAHLRVEEGRVTLVDDAVEPERIWVIQGLSVEADDITTVGEAADGRLSASFVAAGAPGALRVQALNLRPFQARMTLRLDPLYAPLFGAYLPAGTGLGLARGRVSPQVSLEYDARGFLQLSGEATVRDVVIERRGQEPPFITVPRAHLRFQDATYTGGAWSVAHVGLTAEQATLLDAGAPRAAPVEVRDVRFVFDDTPMPVARPGRVTLTASLPGNGTLAARGTGEMVVPSANMSVEVRGVDVGLANIWLSPDAAVAPGAGELGASMAMQYEAATGAVLSGDAWVTGLEILRRGQASPIVRDERVDVEFADIAIDGTGATLGHVRVAASPTLVASDGDGAARLDVESLTLAASGGGLRGEAPTAIEARIALPNDGVVTARGEARLGMPSAALTVLASNVDAMLAARHLPPDSPVTVQRGRVDARLAVAWDRVLDIDGRVTLKAVTVGRRGETTPLVEHAILHADLTNLAVDDTGLSLERVTLTGAPTIIDAATSPPQRFEMERLRLTAADLTWPGRQAARIDGEAHVADGGRARLTGTFHPATLAADVRLLFEAVDVTRVRGYLTDRVPLAVERGRAEGVVHLRHTREGGAHIDSESRIEDLAITLRAARPVRVVDDRIMLSVDNLVIRDGRVALESAVVDGSPQMGRADDGGAFALRAEMRRLVWPDGQAADFTIRARTEPGTIEVQGTFAPATGAMEARLRADDTDLAPFAAALPLEAPVGGRLDAELGAALRPATAPAYNVEGRLALRDVRIGPDDSAPLRAAALTVEGLELADRRVNVGRIALTRPSALIERHGDGSFPLRTMLTPAERPSDTAYASPDPSADAPVPANQAADGERWRIDVDEVQLVEGHVRFLDRTTQPFYSEEVTELALSLRDLSNAEERNAGLAIHGIIGRDAALDLRGEVAPFATPFFLEVSGELRDFAVPRTNPYLQRFLDWIARRGELTTKVHYRIVGDELTATNELLVHRLDVERVRGGEKAERFVGVPLGLAVALLKDARGNIRFTLPVTGELSSPQFNFGDALRSALRNVVGRLVTAPVRAIGSVVRRDGQVEDLAIDPAAFEPGSAAITPDAGTHLQRVADFLRERPYVRLELEPVVTEKDLHVLRAREVTARIQRVQREQQVDFTEAAHRVWRFHTPTSPPPDDLQALVTRLAEREALPSEAARELAERRSSVTRTYLIDVAGIAAERLVTEAAPPVGVSGDGRVEFELKPAS